MCGITFFCVALIDFCVEICFQIPVVVLLQEVLNYQGKLGQHYADNLDGCGLELESRVRDAYYKLIRTLVLEIRKTSRGSLPR